MNQNLILIHIHRKSLLSIYRKRVGKQFIIKSLQDPHMNEIISPKKDILVWGIVDSLENRKIWNGVKSGDIVLFLHEKEFFSKAIIVNTVDYTNIQTRDIDDFFRKYSLLILLENIEKIKLDYKDCISLLIEPHMPTAYYFSIMKVENIKRNLLISTFGTLENAICFLSEPLPVDSSNLDSTSDISSEVLYDVGTSTSKSRINQQKFRKNILKNFNYTCAICGITDIDLLEAAHIIPANFLDVAGKTNNGICFCSNCHKMFDCGFFSFDENYRVVVSTHRSVSKKTLTTLMNKSMTKSKIRPSKYFLKLHRIKHKI